MKPHPTYTALAGVAACLLLAFCLSDFSSIQAPTSLAAKSDNSVQEASPHAEVPDLAHSTKTEVSAAPHDAAACRGCAQHAKPQSNLAGQLAKHPQQIAFELPRAIRERTAREGDTLQFVVGDQIFEVELTMAAFMDSGYALDGTLGNDGLFRIGSYHGIVQAALAPGGDSEVAYVMDMAQGHREWQVKPRGDVLCSSASVEYGHDEINPVEYGHGFKPVPTELRTIPLHESNPGARAVILLDFDGHKLNSEGVPVSNKPFNKLITTDQMTFIYEKVAEWMVFFDCNITTDENVFNVANPAERLRVVFRESSGNSSSFYGAMLFLTDNVDTKVQFDMSYSSVFQPLMADIATTAIHEIGHALYLSHDGGGGDGGYYLGDGNGKAHWSPIMGSNYSRRFVQWSRQEYSGANNNGSGANQGYGRDDLDVMQLWQYEYEIDEDEGSATYGEYLLDANGHYVLKLDGEGDPIPLLDAQSNKVKLFTYYPDDHSDVADATATPLSDAANQETDGIIEMEGDVDVFKHTVTESGVLDLQVCTKVMSALNVNVELVNSAGVPQLSTTVASPLESTEGSLRCYLQPDTYYIKVSAIGRTLPSGLVLHTTYATLGSYALEYSFTAGTYSTHTLTASAGSGGSIDLQGTESTFSGDTRTIRVIPGTGQKIASVMVDGQSIGLNDVERAVGASHTFEDIQADHTVVASFESSSDWVTLPQEGDLHWTFVENVSHVSNETASGSESIKILPKDTTRIDSYMEHEIACDAGEVSFFYKNLSHDGTFEFLVDGEVVLSSTGYQEWTSFSHTLSEGYHTLKWIYKSLGWAFDERDEGVWVDEIQLPTPGAPAAHDQDLGVAMNQATPIRLEGFDHSDAYMNYVVVDQPQHGSMVGVGEDLTYTPDTDYLGSDSFTFRVENSHGVSELAAVNIDVVSPDSGDLVLHWSFDAAEDTASLIHDSSGNDLHGTVNGSAQKVTGRLGQAMAFDGVDDSVIKDIAEELPSIHGIIVGEGRQTGSAGFRGSLQ